VAFAYPEFRRVTGLIQSPGYPGATFEPNPLLSEVWHKFRAREFRVPARPAGSATPAVLGVLLRLFLVSLPSFLGGWEADTAGQGRPARQCGEFRSYPAPLFHRACAYRNPVRSFHHEKYTNLRFIVGNAPDMFKPLSRSINL